MADRTFRAFLHAAYLKSSSDWAATKTTLETLLTGQYDIVTTGDGQRVVSTSINGKTLTFDTEKLGVGGGSAGLMEVVQRCLEVIAKRTDNELTNIIEGRYRSATRADFSRLHDPT